MGMRGEEFNVYSDPFAVPQLWKKPSVIAQDAGENEASFFSQFAACGSSPSLVDPAQQASTTTITYGGFFELPSSVTPVDSNRRQDVESPPAITTAQTPQATPSLASLEEDDRWLTSDFQTARKPMLQSWKSIESPNIDGSDHGVCFLTEAGPTVFDCFTSSSDKFQDHSQERVQIGRYLSALFSLTLGRESVFFKRLPGTNTFGPVLQRLNISGYSPQVVDAFQQSCLKCASHTLDLRSFTQAVYRSQVSSETMIALASSLECSMDSLSQKTIHLYNLPSGSILQLQAVTDEIFQTVDVLKSIITNLPPNATDVDILDAVFCTVWPLDNRRNHIRDLLQGVLKATTGPFLHFLEEWIGTRPDTKHYLTKAQIGQQKYFIKVAAKHLVGYDGQSVDEPDYELIPDRIPKFVSLDVASVILETGRNYRFLQAWSPQSLLCQFGSLPNLKAPPLQWLFDWTAITGFAEKTDRYLEAKFHALRSTHHVDAQKNTQSEEQAVDSSVQTASFWLPVTEFGAAEVLAHPEPPPPPLALEVSCPTTQDDHYLDRPPWPMIPILSFSPLISAQARLVNQEVLRLLFNECQLQLHLEILHNSFLFANGMFCTGLSNALFPAAYSGTESIGLTSIWDNQPPQHWPPSPSDVNLALGDLLAANLGSDVDISFRDIQDDAMCPPSRDKTSIHAFDFLRISYTAPSALSHIIPPRLIMRYDTISQFLLRILYVTHATKQCHRTFQLRNKTNFAINTTSTLFCLHSVAVMSGLANYCLGSVIPLGWLDFSTQVQRVCKTANLDRVCNEFEFSLSPNSLLQAHEKFLAFIENAFFLAPKQHRLLDHVQHLMNTMLKISLNYSAHATNCDVLTQHQYAEIRTLIDHVVRGCKNLQEESADLVQYTTQSPLETLIMALGQRGSGT